MIVKIQLAGAAWKMSRQEKRRTGNNRIGVCYMRGPFERATATIMCSLPSLVNATTPLSLATYHGNRYNMLRDTLVRRSRDRGRIRWENGYADEVEIADYH